MEENTFWITADDVTRLAEMLRKNNVKDGGTIINITYSPLGNGNVMKTLSFSNGKEKVSQVYNFNTKELEKRIEISL